MKHLMIFITASVAATASLAADDGQPFALAAHEAKLDRLMAEARSELQKAQSAEGEKYRAALRELSSTYQKAGDLDGVLATRKEAERFDVEGKISRAHLSSNPELLAVQKAVTRAFGEIDTRATQTEVELLQSHGRDLVALTEGLTKAGKIEEAIQVRNRVDALKARIGALREGAISQLRVNPPLKHDFDLGDLEALGEHWELKAAFEAGANGLKAPRGPSNEIRSRFELGGDFEVRIKFHFGQAQYTNTGGTWVTVFGQRLGITNGWHAFDMDLRVQRSGTKIIFEKNGKVSEHEVPEGKMDEHTPFSLWWRSRSCHIKELSVTAQSVQREG